MSLPNFLTLVRMPLTFAIVGFMYGRWVGAATIAFWLFIAAAVSDYYDGKLARERKQISDFGKFMDALTDKVLVLGVMVALLDLDYLRLPDPIVVMAVLVVITREFMVSGLRMMAASQGVVLAAERGGKVKTLIQMIALGFLLGEPMAARDWVALLPEAVTGSGAYGLFVQVVHGIGLTLFALSIWFTVSSMWTYFSKYGHVLRGTPPPPASRA